MSEGITSGAALTILKEIYGNWFTPYYEVEGAKEELIRRIKALNPAEKALYGTSEDDL
jgi:hypothetical protein